MTTFKLSLTHRRMFAIIITCVVVGFTFMAMAPMSAGIDQSTVETNRKNMWAAFRAKYPKESSDITAYGENPSATVILFRREQDASTYKFSMKKGAIEEILHMKAVLRVNRITFSGEKDFNLWVLWYNGEVELMLGTDEK